MSISDLSSAEVIRKAPSVCGGEACIRDTRYTVSGLVQWQKMGLTDDQIQERHPDLSAADLELAWSYYRENRDEIDELIRQDEDAWRMARIYSDEDFDYLVVLELRKLGHDVLRVQEAGQGSQGIEDSEVLAFACREGRAVLTFNRRHFINLHRSTENHFGVLVCTRDKDAVALASRIDESLRLCPDLAGKLIRINRPHVPWCQVRWFVVFGRSIEATLEENRIVKRNFLGIHGGFG
jgi:uncharacterized protein (DUF433 family)